MKRLPNEFLILYERAETNARELLQEAEILFDAGKFPRAYALAFTALEEISKSQLAADVYTGLITEEEFQRHYRDHKKKIGRMLWATEDAKRYLDSPEGDYVDVQEPTFANRMDAMYVSINARRIALVSIAALLASVPVRNESNRDRDGNWWISQEQLAKYSYMVGFFDGMELGENFSIWGTMNTQKADPAVGKAVSSYDQFANKYLTNVTNGQVVQGLDEFYSDYRNRRIKVASGVWIVLN